MREDYMIRIHTVQNVEGQKQTLDMTSRVKGSTMSYHEWTPVF